MVTCVPALGPTGLLQGFLQLRQRHLEGPAQEAGGGHAAGGVDEHQDVGDGEQVGGEGPPANPGGLVLEAVDVRPEQLSELQAVGGAADGERSIEEGPQFRGDQDFVFPAKEPEGWQVVFQKDVGWQSERGTGGELQLELAQIAAPDAYPDDDRLGQQAEQKAQQD